MNEENQINYYAIIPATVRYSKKLKASEKLLYGEITALSNKNGYCYAQNRYFADLYDVSIETVSRWISNLQKFGFIKIKVNRNENKEVISRYIYIVDIPYQQKNQYPYIQKNQEGIDENVKENNIKYNIDDLFYLIINNSNKISKHFFEIIERLEFNYKPYMLQYMKKDKIDMLKNIIYVLYDLYNSGFYSLLQNIKRENLVNLYLIAMDKQPNNLLNYYKKSIINSNKNCKKMEGFHYPKLSQINTFLKEKNETFLQS